MQLPSRIRKLLGRDAGSYRALNQLDRRLERYLGRHGFFVEAGANDGLAQSNTYFFERERDWHGLLIEPVPELAEQCRKNRPRATVVNCALGSFAQHGSELRMSYCNLMSLVHGGMPAEQEAQHLRIGREVQHLKESHELVVPCQALGRLLDELQLPPVDLLSLDVEGYEENALLGLDFPRQAPRYILVEARFEAAVRSVLAPHYDEVERMSHHDLLFGRRR